jgi:hypothetical protein
LVFGSYFGDWNMSDDFMRATLTPASYGLAAIWELGFSAQSMAMGETLGFGLRRTLNVPIGYSYGPRYLAIMGDPTLRQHTLAPPASLVGTQSSGGLALNWNTNSAPGVQYSVYNASSVNGPFTPVSGVIPGPSFGTNNYTTGQVYLVRGLKLQTSGSGTYTNISQGAFWP